MPRASLSSSSSVPRKKSKGHSPSETSSSSPSPKKKKQKKSKTPRKIENKNKNNKRHTDRLAKASESPERKKPRQKDDSLKRDFNTQKPNFQLSGLLDGEVVNEPSVKDESTQHNLAMRSRSRDEPISFERVRSPRRNMDKGKGKGKGKGSHEEDATAPKKEPTFETSGLLGLEDNSKNGIALKFSVPPEARCPATKWRLYILTKPQDPPKIIHLKRVVGVLFGKDRRVADIPTDHPTCSKQQAVLHFRQVDTGEVKPYIMDLESTNGTFLNGQRLDPARYYEMRERDVLKFAMSSREFVLLHAGSASHMAIDPKLLQSDSE